ncbi:aldehyde dehydrogenase [Frankia sp. CcI156]|uniref:Succinate semialdehyde dehydrogenase n=1 Tax=Frankia casuarinae (strain DSM 45818 / CECT 9043 / HFP020203 / CcI3) TaxID=106370 RepID=Q2J6B7_FRACC|nr:MULTISPECIES: aldehyde dehydrogenase family protein [Frankia]ABD13175.1 succinate semialdehyde dehydrogenase [Frankia casuarinae]ETA00573.1 succinate semialdehyde dehydrogenase [Frankia sp. CcI6]EYT89903.1 succinate semialdehyde dehydrogenase [Frankia casuarinae]KDA41533.1 succinate semialdehyde dehydrogenase [Frankia sp. BMG5.23]OAA20415.1 succinate semialdehyde dehydrogenase [Frankia casuarinae]
MSEPTPFWLAGKPATGSATTTVRHPFDGAEVAVVAQPDPDQVETAVAAAAAVAPAFAALPAHVRAGALAGVSKEIARRGDELARLITAESGKPLTWSRAEVARASSTFRWGAEEARRFAGELTRLDTDPPGEGRLALTRRFPRGPVLGITPFNFPLNLVAHKVAPALAVGAPIIVKPAPRTPLSALFLGDLLADAGLPEGSWSVLPIPNDRLGPLVADPRLPVVSFTGSGPVGWSIRDTVPRKHVVLELGGNAAVLVAADYATPADLARAAGRIALFANYQAGQSCIAVQRVYADRTIVDELLAEIVAAVRALHDGDPADPATDVGPLIDVAAAERVEAWITEAVEAGATLVCGGTRHGTSLSPAVLTGVPPTAKVVSEEVFGPVIVVAAVDGVDEGFARINDSAYGLQAGVFTHDLATAFRAHRELQVGGVVIGDVPSYRADQMPYGGTKGSGIGREGVRSAMTDLTEDRVLVLTGLDL